MTKPFTARLTAALVGLGLLAAPLAAAAPASAETAPAPNTSVSISGLPGHLSHGPVVSPRWLWIPWYPGPGFFDGEN